MIINQFSSFPYGGAGTAARRLHEKLRQLGVDSRFFFWKSPKRKIRDESFKEMLFLPEWDHPLLRPLIHKYRKIRQRTIRKEYDNHLSKRARNFEVFSTPRLMHDTCFDLAGTGGDLFHLHWISFFIDYPSFFASLPDHVPIVWTLHDMNPLTGGCHYSGGCSRFTTGCGNCPQISMPGPRDVSSTAFRTKQRSLRKKNLHVVTPSQWLCDLARTSRVFPRHTSFRVIRLGFDLQTFWPINKQAARRRLGIDSQAVLLAFGAEDIGNHRKGFHHLVQTLPQIKSQRPVECLVFGSGKIQADRKKLPKIHHFGFVDSVEKQAWIYAAADVFVLPSREDNSPQTGLEAMACGTPVVAFDTGGVPEYVVPGETGLLAPVGDTTQMAQRISWLVDRPDARLQMSQRARALMESRYCLDQQTGCHIQMYRELLAAKTQRAQRKAA